MTIIELRAAIENKPARGAWAKGIKEYALELVDNIAEGSGLSAELPEYSQLEPAMLNGADSWAQYSRGGCSLIYDCDIAARLCSPSELKKTRNGERRPNAREDWLDIQILALYQAANMVLRLARR